MNQKINQKHTQLSYFIWEFMSPNTYLGQSSLRDRFSGRRFVPACSCLREDLILTAWCKPWDRVRYLKTLTEVHHARHDRTFLLFKINSTREKESFIIVHANIEFFCCLTHCTLVYQIFNEWRLCSALCKKISYDTNWCCSLVGYKPRS